MSSLWRETSVDMESLQDLDIPFPKTCSYTNPTDSMMRKTIGITKRPRRPLLRFPRTAVRILEQWLLDHRDAPYATQHEQDELKLQTGLKRSQIMNWFANARKRGKIQTLQLSPLASQQAQAPSPVPLFPQVANLHPFERWLHLGLEHEAASPSAIEEALLKCQRIPAPQAMDSVHRTALSNLCGTSTNWQYFRRCGSSVSSLEIRSYAANAKSVSSDQWRHPDRTTQILTKSARRHRRFDTNNDGTVGVSDHREIQRKFQCSFCNDCFKKKHDWQRHEKSQHLPLEKWICCPQGSVNVDPATNEVTCAFCGTLEPDPEHLQNHGYTQCISRSSADRTFYRKDHLRQHLRLMHNDCPMLPSMEAWKSAVNSIHSRCGFCGAELTTWGGRVEHLAEHFRNGARMVDWVGDWGFEPEIMEILERATLPSTRQRHKKKNQGTLPLESRGGCKDHNTQVEMELFTNLEEFDNESQILDISAPANTSHEASEHFEYSSIQCSSIFDSLENLSSLDELFYENGDLDSGIRHTQSWPTEEIQHHESQHVQQCMLSSKEQLTSSELYSAFDMISDHEFGFNAVPAYTSLSLETGVDYPILYHKCAEDVQEYLMYQLHDNCFVEPQYMNN